MTGLFEKARAKVNLTLAIRGRRADGYHVLDSLVAFADASDSLTLAPGLGLSLTVDGPTAPAAGNLEDNLVLKAARALAKRRQELIMGRFHLTKHLPVAAGLGGGSSDAAAALRLIARANNLPFNDPDILECARLTGADVTVCLEQQPRWMRGAGESLSAPVDLPALPIVLVNPGVATPTADIFRALALPVGQVAPYDDTLAEALSSPNVSDVIAIIAKGSNDLEPPAFALHPVIEEALLTMRKQRGCRLARMSGSGATVFGLFETNAEAAHACETIALHQPRWWRVHACLSGSIHN